MRGTISLLLSVIPSLSQGRRKVWCLKSFMKGFTLTYWKQWWNGNSFFCVSSRLQFGPPKNLHFCFFLLIFSAQCLSPDCIGYFLVTLPVYLTLPTLSYFSSCSCALIVQPRCIWLLFQSYSSFFMKTIDLTYMKPFDLTYIGGPTSFVCIKQEKIRQQTTGFDVSIVYIWVFCPFHCWWAGVPSLQLLNLFDYKWLGCASPLVFLPFCWTIARYNSYVWKHRRVHGTTVFFLGNSSVGFCYGGVLRCVYLCLLLHLKLLWENKKVRCCRASLQTCFYVTNMELLKLAKSCVETTGEW